MDLSQQELPLTAYFSRGSKDARSNVAVGKKDNLCAGGSQSVSLKRKRNNVQRSPASPSSRSVGQSKLRPTSLQLPTPAASTRKRVRGQVEDVEELPGKSQLTSTGAVVQKDFAFGPTPSPSGKGTEDVISESPSISLPTPSTHPRKAPIDIEFVPNPPLSNHTDTGIPIPQTPSRRAAEPRHCIDHSPLAHSSRPLPSRPKLSVFVPREAVSATPSKTIDVFPVPSSQSQYLLHLDATPKRKQRSQHTEDVLSSQTQEERELTLSPLIKPINLPTGHFPGKHTPRANAQTNRLDCGGRKSQHACTLGSSSVGSPIRTPTGPSHFFAKKASDEILSLSPSRRKTFTSCHTPSRKTQSPRGRTSTRHDSIENIPPVSIEESLTESESEADVFQVPRRSDGCPSVRRGFAQSNLPSVEDSETEAESDTDILRCVAEIGKRRACERRSQVSRQDAPPPPLISPLVSPVRPRIAAMPTTTWGGAGSSVPGTPTPHPTTVEQSRLRSDPDSLPSVVREFIRMFPGEVMDESYPADFPQSLRI